MATWRHCVLGTMKPTAIVITLEKTNPKATAVLVVRFSAMGLCTKTSLCHPGLTKNDRERLPPNSHLHRRPVRPVRSAVSPQRRGHNARVGRRGLGRTLSPPEAAVGRAPSYTLSPATVVAVPASISPLLQAAVLRCGRVIRSHASFAGLPSASIRFPHQFMRPHS